MNGHKPTRIIQFTIFFISVILMAFTYAGREGNLFHGTAEITGNSAQEIPQKIDSAIEEQARTYKCRVTARVVDPRGNAYYFGYDGRKNEPIRDFSGSIDIGSCTKLFTATSILQLMEKGKFSLDSKLVDLLPDKELYAGLLTFEDRDYTDEVRLYQLLNHTSGFPDYFAGSDDLEIKMHADSSLRFTPKQLISLARRLYEPDLKPGEKFRYSNVNYILLGLIIEKYSGLSYQQYIQNNILDQLGLKSTYFSSLESRKGRAPGHFKGEPAEMPATMALSAGDIVSTLDDMTAFIKAWSEGKLFQAPETLELVKTQDFNPMGGGFSYGLGIINLLKLSLGHGGQTFGFTSYIGSVPNGGQFAFGCDDASASSWAPALKISRLVSDME